MLDRALLWATRRILRAAYDGASKSRRSMSSWQPTKGDADADVLADLPALRERSRDLIRNNPLAAGAISTKVTSIVGTGLQLQARLDREALGMDEETADLLERQIEREWRLWADSAECAVARNACFAELQDMAMRATLESGDVFVLLPMVRRGLQPYTLRVQMVEADRVSNPDYGTDTATLAGGVERDPWGAPVAYHIQDIHPGATYAQPGWRKVPAFGGKTGRRNVLHLYRHVRPGQTRGVPDLAPVIEAFRQLGKYSEAELQAAVVTSMFTVFVKSEGGLGLGEPEANAGGSNAGEYNLGAGAILDLMPGESIETANPLRPNAAFDGFVLAVLRQIGVALELPFEILVKHFTASYSAARAALLEATKFYLGRRAWLARNFCQPIYAEWMAEAVMLGRIQAPGFLDGDPAIQQAYLGAEWIGPGFGVIDPLKEINAAKGRIELGITTLAEETASLTGGDWEQKHPQRMKERRMRLEAGLDIDPLEMAGRAPKDAEADTEADTDTETEDDA